VAPLTDARTATHLSSLRTAAEEISLPHWTISPVTSLASADHRLAAAGARSAAACWPQEVPPTDDATVLDTSAAARALYESRGFRAEGVPRSWHLRSTSRDFPNTASILTGAHKGGAARWQHSALIVGRVAHYAERTDCAAGATFFTDAPVEIR
jgi:hypothetical protein